MSTYKTSEYHETPIDDRRCARIDATTTRRDDDATRDDATGDERDASSIFLRAFLHSRAMSRAIVASDGRLGIRHEASTRRGRMRWRETSRNGTRGRTRATTGEAEASDANARRSARRGKRESGKEETKSKVEDANAEDANARTPEWLRVLEESAESDPEIASLLEGTERNAKAIEAKIRERFDQKRDKIYQERGGSTVPTLVTFREYNSFNLWIWVEAHNTIAEMEKPLIEEVFKAWFVLGKLGGFNSNNMQVQENFDTVSFMDYSMEQAHEFSTDTSTHVFHEMSELEYRAKWCRVWVDLGSSDEVCIDVLINSLIQFSREYFGLKQIIIGGQNDDWTTEGSEYGDIDLQIDETFGRGPRSKLTSR